VVAPFTIKEGNVSGEGINTVSVNFSVDDQLTVRIDNGKRDSSDSEEFRVHLVSLGAFVLGRETFTGVHQFIYLPLTMR
jgi:hypothetical protein